MRLKPEKGPLLVIEGFKKGGGPKKRQARDKILG